MDIGEDEEERFVESAVADAVAQYREEKRQSKLAMQAQTEDDQANDENAGSGAAQQQV